MFYGVCLSVERGMRCEWSDAVLLLQEQLLLMRIGVAGKGAEVRWQQILRVPI